MALTLEQYIDYLDTRKTAWPAPPEVEKPKAKAYLVPIPGIRAVIWSVYGTLLNISGGELLFERPERFMMDLALEKTIQEFKMWGSMTRKSGQPSEQLGAMYADVLNHQRLVPGGAERHPEVCADQVWEALIKKLMKKDYQFDAASYGSLNEFSKKVAYFFHASLQGINCHVGAALAMRHLNAKGVLQGVMGNGQCFTMGQLKRCLKLQDPSSEPEKWLEPSLSVFSYEVRSRKPSDRLFRKLLGATAEKGLKPEEVLHIGARVGLNVVPAKRLGMKAGLFAGDRASLEANPKQMEAPVSRPDVLLTELTQIVEVVP
jgi:FMN phosphatase YigB (HAD superfamily)